MRGSRPAARPASPSCDSSSRRPGRSPSPLLLLSPHTHSAPRPCPPLLSGWADAGAYLLLPVLLVVSQYASQKIMQPANASDDPSQAQAQTILKILPVMIGWFALNVPSGLTLYWFTNNILTTGQTLWLRSQYVRAAGLSPPQRWLSSNRSPQSAPQKEQLCSARNVCAWHGDRHPDPAPHCARRCVSRQNANQAAAGASTPASSTTIDVTPSATSRPSAPMPPPAALEPPKAAQQQQQQGNKPGSRFAALKAAEQAQKARGGPPQYWGDAPCVIDTRGVWADGSSSIRAGRGGQDAETREGHSEGGEVRGEQQRGRGVRVIYS